MKTNKQNPDFLHIGRKIMSWYNKHGRDLPFRHTQDPYKIWICEIVFQQTRIKQGLLHYTRFIERFPDVETLAHSVEEEVMLYWKGLGYYSRAINLHQASKQIVDDFNGKFPTHFEDVLKLKGVGKYTAAAICSICFHEKIAAVDGNFYRVLSRIFMDNFNISSAKAFQYFSHLALPMMPEKEPGNFNQAMMDLGSEICKPKNPKCGICPVSSDCMAYLDGEIPQFPVKKNKIKVQNLALEYYFVHHENQFLIQQRNENLIWKKLFEFPTQIHEKFQERIKESKTLHHKLTHRNLNIVIHRIQFNSKKEMNDMMQNQNLQIVTLEESHSKSFPKPLQNYIESFEQEFLSKKKTETEF